MNRAERRAFDKAALCVERLTKIPGVVLRKVDPARLDYLAKSRERAIDARGFVRRIGA